MDVSLDTDITIHLYDAGKEEVLFKYFDKCYMHEFIPFSFYELLYLDYLQSEDYEKLKEDYDKINKTAYPKHPMDFVSRIKRVVHRFSRHGSDRDKKWMREFCNNLEIDYRSKMLKLQSHLQDEIYIQK